MASLRMTLLDLLNKDEQGADPGFLRDGVRLLAQELLAGTSTARARLARKRILWLREIFAEVDEVTRELTELARASAAALTAIPGVADLTAGEILAEVGDPRRYRTKAQFAMANGTAPLPASSGRTNRHRLNRGGNRQLNRMIHFIALTQVSRDPEGRAYYMRKQAEGRTKKDALRCLKRRISDRLFQALRTPISSAGLTWELEWAVGRRYFSTESMDKLFQPTNEEVVQALLELQSA